MGTGALQWLVGVAVMPVLRPTCCYTCVLCNVWEAGHVTVGTGCPGEVPAHKLPALRAIPVLPVQDDM